MEHNARLTPSATDDGLVKLDIEAEGKGHFEIKPEHAHKLGERLIQYAAMAETKTGD